MTGTPKWRFAAGGDVVGAPVVADGRVHFGSADHVLYTLDAARSRRTNQTNEPNDRSPRS
ncbi:hypothetical protein ACWF1R_06375 [Bacillus subtilis]